MPIFPSQHLLVDIIVSSLLKLVFRVNKEKSHLFFSSHVLRVTHMCTFFPPEARGFLFQQVGGLVRSVQLVPVGTELLVRAGSSSLQVTAGIQVGLSETAYSLVLRTCVLESTAFVSISSCLLHWAIELYYMGTKIHSLLLL